MIMKEGELTGHAEVLAHPKPLGASEDPNANSVGSMSTTRLCKSNESAERGVCHSLSL